jgi:hypothetical protein
MWKQNMKALSLTLKRNTPSLQRNEPESSPLNCKNALFVLKALEQAKRLLQLMFANIWNPLL